MTTHRNSWLLALTLVACTSLEAREAAGPSKPTPDGPSDPTGPKIPNDPETDKSPAVSVVVASVTLETDCPDPDPAPATPAVIAPTPSPVRKAAPSTSAPMPPRPGDAPSAVAGRRACQQSTLQLEIRNDGKAETGIRIAAIELRDVQSNSVLVPIRSRLPSAWADGATYEQWNERITANTKLNVSYKLTPPEWYTVEQKLGSGVDSHGRQFELGVTVEIDGKPITVRSPAFTRAPEIIMPPT